RERFVVVLAEKRRALQSSHRTLPIQAAPATPPLLHANALAQRQQTTSSSPCRTPPACPRPKSFRSASRSLRPLHARPRRRPSRETPPRCSPPAAATTSAD